MLNYLFENSSHSLAERNEVHILIGTRGSEIIEYKGNITKVHVRGHSKEELKCINFILGMVID